MRWPRGLQGGLTVDLEQLEIIYAQHHIGIVVSDHHVVPSRGRHDAIEILLIPHPG